jgi:hypothetical protein
MDNAMFWVVFVVAAIVFYRLLSRRALTPKAKVTAMLRRYRALERTGLSEQDCLLQLLATRKEWRNFSHRFLAGIVSRLRSKEDVMRFVTVSEDYGYHYDPYPQLAKKIDLDGAMTEIACLFSRFGFRLQVEGRYKEAEFVQKLALRLQPDEYFTNLPLAATYHETGRYADAVPLFKEGLAQLERFQSGEPMYSPAKCLAADAELTKLRNLYSKMYKACLKAAGNKTLSGSAVLMELFG